MNGTAALGNGGAGIQGGGPGLVIGGTGAGEGNLVSGNLIGMDLLAEGMTVQGNAVGVDDSGIAPLPNGGHGIKLGSPGTAPNIIGAAAPGGPGANHIAYNLGRGISVGQGAHHTMRGNSIHDNGLGIDLAGNGPTANDPLDADTGINNLQNFPILQSVEHLGPQGSGSTRIHGKLNSVALDDLRPRLLRESRLLELPARVSRGSDLPRFLRRSRPTVPATPRST